MATIRIIALLLIAVSVQGQTLKDWFGESLVGYWGAQGFAKSGGEGDVLELDGTGDYVEVDHDNSIDPTNDFTVCAWIYVDAWGQYAAVFSERDASNYQFQFRLYGTDELNFLPSGGGSLSTTSADLAEDTWYFVVASYDGGTVTIYVNGDEEVSDSGKSMTSYDLPLHIGRSQTGSIYDFNGSLSNLRIYDRALSAAEVASLYDGYNITDGLVGYWPLDGDYDDYSGNDNDGTAGGDPQFQTELLPTYIGNTMYDASGKGNDGTAEGDAYFNGNAMVFDGDGDYVDCGNDNSVNVLNNFTLSLWIKAEAGVGSRNTYFFKYSGGGDQGYYFRGHYFKVCAPDGVCSIIEAPESDTDGKWKHVVAVRDTDQIITYVNGDLYDQGADNTTGVVSNSLITKMGSGLDPYEGDIAHAMIFNRALTADEINDLYHGMPQLPTDYRPEEVRP